MCEALHQELEEALRALDRIPILLLKENEQHSSQLSSRDHHPLRDEQDEDEQSASAVMRTTIESLKHSLEEERSRNLSLESSLSSESSLSRSLQQDILTLDRDKVDLHGCLSRSREENEVLSKVLQKISKDHEELQRRFDKVMQDDPRDTKLTALRNAAKTLEAENSNLGKERRRLDQEVKALKRKPDPISKYAMSKRIRDSEELVGDLKNELAAKDAERKMFMERFERLESEKLNVLRQLISVQNELELCQADLKRADEVNGKLTAHQADTDDTLQTLRDSRRSVENRVQGLLAENKELAAQATRNKHDRETVQGLELAKAEAVERISRLTNQLVEKESYYESQMAAMQREVQQRFEELDSNRDEELGQVKERYIKLFQEKAEECVVIREEHSQCPAAIKDRDGKIADLQYREEELQNLLAKTQSSIEEKYRGSSEEVLAEIQTLKNHTAETEAELSNVKKQYDDLQISYRSSVDILQSRLFDINDILQSQRLESEAQKIFQQQNDSDTNCDQSLLPEGKIVNGKENGNAKDKGMEEALDSGSQKRRSDKCHADESKEEVGGGGRVRSGSGGKKDPLPPPKQSKKKKKSRSSSSKKQNVVRS